MSDARSPVNKPVQIGRAANPPTVVTPDPATMFSRRAERFRTLAQDHVLAPYLRFLGDLSEAQHNIQRDLPQPAIKATDAVEQSIAFGMPVLPRSHFVPDHIVIETIRRLLDHVGGTAMPDQARAALERLRLAMARRDSRSFRHGPVGPAQLTEGVAGVVTPGNESVALRIAGCIDAVLTDSIPIEHLAEHIFIGTALQVHFARSAALAATVRLHFIGDFICPVCGAPPATSAIVGWSDAERTRFCACSLCGTRWNAVRVKCLACSSTKGIHYQAIEGRGSRIKAECCDECRCYVKIMTEDADPTLEPIADDVASLGLDMLVREAGYRRAGMNLFLLGF